MLQNWKIQLLVVGQIFKFLLKESTRSGLDFDSYLLPRWITNISCPLSKHSYLYFIRYFHLDHRITSPKSTNQLIIQPSFDTIKSQIKVFDENTVEALFSRFFHCYSTYSSPAYITRLFVITITQFPLLLTRSTNVRFKIQLVLQT